MLVEREWLRRVVFGRQSARRFTQESPILPDVWMVAGVQVLPRSQASHRLSPHSASRPFRRNPGHGATRPFGGHNRRASGGAGRRRQRTAHHALGLDAGRQSGCGGRFVDARGTHHRRTAAHAVVEAQPAVDPHAAGRRRRQRRSALDVSDRRHAGALLDGAVERTRAVARKPVVRRRPLGCAPGRRRRRR